MTIALWVNGAVHEVEAAPDTPLLFVLRNELKLLGAKLGCGLEQCGACAVLVDGEVTLCCASSVELFAGKEITTVEGLTATAVGRRVQEAFVAATAAQCGYCTAGLVVAVTGLLQKNACPDRETAKLALAPHLCRCGSHPRVLKAVEMASTGP